MSSVLAGIEEASGFDARECERYVGTSAGSIVAAALAAGTAPASRLGHLPEQPPITDDDGDDANGGPGLGERAIQLGLSVGSFAAAPVAAVGLSAVTPGGAAVRRLALSRVRVGRRPLSDLGRTIDGLGARFDGRLAVSAVDLDSGRRVMFGEPGAPPADVGEAVEASCAIPGYFRPVEIGGRRYVDGGVWSPTNMDRTKVARGKNVLCLNPTGSSAQPLTSPLGALAAASRSIARVEALVLQGRGARVTQVAPDDASLEAIGPNLMDPRPRRRVIAAGLEQGRRIGRG